MTDAYIIDTVRTPRSIGKMGKGALSTMHPEHLSASVLAAIRDRNNLNTAEVDDVIWGVSAGRGLQAGDVAIPFQQKSDGDLGDTLGRHTAKFINTLNGVDDFLERLGDTGFHFLRRRSAQGGRDGDDRQLDVGKLIDADRAEANPTKHDKQQVDHCRKHRPLDAQVGERESFFGRLPAHALGLRFGRVIDSQRVIWRSEPHL